jgi:hypothetical protein
MRGIPRRLNLVDKLLDGRKVVVECVREDVVVVGARYLEQGFGGRRAGVVERLSLRERDDVVELGMDDQNRSFRDWMGWAGAAKTGRLSFPGL